MSILTGIVCIILGFIIGGLIVSWLAYELVIVFLKELFGVK